MSTGPAARGREAVGALLTKSHRTAFRARATLRNLLVTGNRAVGEYDIDGKDVGEFAGVRPTQKDISLPLGVVYDVAGGEIRAARIYFDLDRFRRPVGAA